MCSEASPKRAIPSSASPKNKMPWRGNRAEAQPPARLPRPRPSMKALTTMATDSAFAVDRKQRALPNHLIDQRGHSGKQEERTEQEVLPFLLAAVKIQSGREKKEQVKDQKQQDGTCGHVSPERVSGR